MGGKPAERRRRCGSQFHEKYLHECTASDIIDKTDGRRSFMSVSYDKLWKLLIDKKMSRTELKDAAGISFNVLARMGA